MAASGHLLAFDNLSGLPAHMADALCRLSTGNAFAKRRLYSDDEQHVVRASRPVIVNGIDDLLTRPDLADRGIVMELPNIPDDHRVDEAELWRRFEAARPRLLGALLHAAATALRRLPDTTIPQLPRMAGFARWVAAAEEALPWGPGEFLDAYNASRADAQLHALDASALGRRLLELAPFDGLIGKLFEELWRWPEPQSRHDPTWPRTQLALGEQLRRPQAPLRVAGVVVTFPPRTNRGRPVVIRREQCALRAPPAHDDAGQG